MSPLQLGFILLTIVAPPALWLVSRRLRSDRFDRTVCRAVAVILLIVEFADLGTKWFDPGMPPGSALPMQLCDWALFAVAAALWFRWQTCFEVSYFWGLAGTLQALFTPAIGADVALWRRAGFFMAHSGIVIGVVFLLLAMRMRPRLSSLPRVILWSEIYLALALFANLLTNANYGFLTHKPENPSMLDWFSDQPWLYRLEINVTALVFFAVLYLPWFIWDRGTARNSSDPAASSTRPI